MKYAGKDATQAFDAAGHAHDIVSKLGLDHLAIGVLVGATNIVAVVEHKLKVS